MKRNFRTTYLMLADTILLMLSIYIGFLLRFDGSIPIEYFESYRLYLFNIIIIKIVVFYFFRLYNSLWMYASVEELMEIVVGAITANLAVLGYMYFMHAEIPRSIYILVTMTDTIFMGGLRLGYRVYRRFIKKGHLFSKRNRKKVMVIGGGDAGAMVIKEYKKHTDLDSEVIVVIDDDYMKKGKVISGVNVFGDRNDIESVVKVKKIDEIVIAIPSASKKEISSLASICKKTGCKLKILPGMYEIIDGDVNLSQIREVEIGDLLGRDEIKLDTENIEKFIKNKKIMVTGGAGSIGSEIVRQIAGYDPEFLLILDINENGVYDIQQELLREYGEEKLNFQAKVGSVRDLDRLEHLFKKYKPEVIFHAAAHKHVPLMEDSPHEAIKNNIFGTLNLVRLADKYGVDKFVQISTDKAVNPTNVMGATKRMCEIIIRTFNPKSDTEFVAVRFGNVLGSNGSVIPFFKNQIEEGGPVTVTHPDIIRYFMTIPEATRLVMQAGAMAEGGEIFVLDMGEPVKIVDLAEDLIRLSGLVPYEDIDIVFTGLRPGEKLFEELLMSEEGILSTKHDKIFVGKSFLTDMNMLLSNLDQLKATIEKKGGEDIKRTLKKLVPTYRPAENVENVVKFESNRESLVRK